MARENVWVNSDGLVVGFGTRTVEENSGMAVSLGGGRQQLVIPIRASATKILDTIVARQLDHAAIIPANALLESAKLFVTTAFVGATAVLDIGTYLASDGTTVNATGLFAAVPVATLADNAVVTGAGALIGTVLASNQKIGITWSTAAFTAGEATLVVEYIQDQLAS